VKIALAQLTQITDALNVAGQAGACVELRDEAFEVLRAIGARVSSSGGLEMATLDLDGVTFVARRVRLRAV
jgi:site-specific recombinase XerD